MDNSPLDIEQILRNFGGVDSNSLEKIINFLDGDYEIDTIKHSPYFTIDNLPSNLKRNNSNLVALSLNAQSLRAKFSSLESMIRILSDLEIEPDILMIQETWLNEDICPPYLELDGYNAIAQGYRITTHGGLITYIKSHLVATKIDICPNTNVFEGLVLKVENPENKSMPNIIVSNIYKPPHNNNNKENIEQFMREIAPIMTYINETNSEALMGGDWNINILKVNENSTYSEFLDMMFTNSLHPKITMPTRFATHSASLLDNFYCKVSDHSLNASAGIIMSGISDHLPYFICFDNFTKCKASSTKFVKCKVNRPEAIEAFLNELKSKNLYNELDHSLESGPDQNYDKMIKTITELKEKHLPYKFVKFNKHRHKDNKWMTYSIINSIKTRDKKYYKLKCMNQNDPGYLALKRNLGIYNGILKKCIRETKAEYYNKMFETYKHDIKNTWKTISSLLCKSSKKNNPIKEIKINDKLCTNQKDICNGFNSFFVNIGPKLASEINENNKIPYSSYLKKVITSEFMFDLITEDDINKIVTSLKPKASAGYDGLSLKMLKLITPHVIKPLTLIINQSLITGIFPEKLKIAKVIPLFKKDDKLLMDNYRPVSLLTSISKIFEKVAHNQLTKYFTHNKLFFKSQYGFRGEHSTELASLELVDRIMESFEKKQTPIAIYMDLSKAFDTLDHKILLHKLRYYGIKGKELDWFQSYLTNRQQFVEINGTISDSKSITTGVPQGSVLGPLLFLIYMNDIEVVSSMFDAILFADDSTFKTTMNASLPAKKIDKRYENRINDELKKIYDWLAVNKLSLNIRKTKCMFFHTPNTKFDFIPKLSINDIEIERVKNFNFLGLTVNENLSWKAHIDKIGSKISKSGGVINRLKHFLPTHILRIIYCSTIQSNLMFSLLAWGYDCNRLAKIQKRIIRNICCEKFNAHTEPLFKRLCLLKLEDLFDLNTLKFYYKLKKGKVPAYFQSYTIQTNAERHGRDARQGSLISMIRSRIDLTDKCLRIHLPVVLNSTPQSALDKVATHSYVGFANYVKGIMINSYSAQCNINNCYVCGS